MKRLLLIVCIVLLFISCGPKPKDLHKPEKGVLRAMTLNIAHGRKDGPNQLFLKKDEFVKNLDEIALLIKREQPDIIALQEADGPSFWSGNFNHVEYLKNKTGYSCFFRGEHMKTVNLSYGTALLSRVQLQDPVSQSFSSPVPAPIKGFVIATIAWPGKPGTIIDIVSVHLDFSNPSNREKQTEELTAFLKTRKNPVIVLGDFNCEWDDKKTVLKKFAKDLDLKTFKPEDKAIKTFSKSKRRLDWIFIPKDHEFISHRILPDIVSDHKAVIADIGLVVSGKDK
jgi:endonuclease/exonuclease/phosphatase family metal-dependent hydrolase